jgi:hypothetical protein
MAIVDEDFSANAMLAALAPSGGYRGITASQNGTTANSIDIAINGTRAYAVLGDGTILTKAALQAAAGTAVITGVPNGAQSIYVDASTDGKETPVFSAGASAPSARAIAVATFTAASGAIGTVTAATAGITL